MDKAEIAKVIEGYLNEKGLFLVDIKISTDNDIEVSVESFESIVALENCIDITRIIEGVYDRDIEDYSLTVTSAGLDLPFKVLNQYKKYVNNEVEVVFKNGGKTKAMLSNVSEQGIELTTSKMVKKEGSKKKTEEITKLWYDFPDIKSCKLVIKFK